jgi:hypothetical protein
MKALKLEMQMDEKSISTIILCGQMILMKLLLFHENMIVHLLEVWRPFRILMEVREDKTDYHEKILLRLYKVL